MSGVPIVSKYPAVTVNRFGKGRAIYVAAAAQASLMRPLYRQLYGSLGLQPGPKTPDGVAARAVDGRVLYVNTTSEAREVPLDGPMKGLLSAESGLGGALSRLMVVSEAYPDLKANQNFLALQSQLEGTENRIAVARRDFIQAVQAYNTEIRTFPGRLWHSVMYSDLPVRATFEATSADADKAPQVKFK